VFAVFRRRQLSVSSGVLRTLTAGFTSMARPVMKRRQRVRVEFSLSPELAEQVYDYADAEGLTPSQTGERLLALAPQDDASPPPDRRHRHPLWSGGRRAVGNTFFRRL
jgi:hypothetical protein